MRRFHSLAKLLFPAFLIFPYVAQAELPFSKPALASPNGSWRDKPNFSDVSLSANCKPYENVKILTQFIVDKNGTIVNPSIVKSSGDEQTDIDVLKRLRTGQVYPFLKNGMPITKKATLPISITCMPRSQAEQEQDKQRQEILKQLGIPKSTGNF